jgi:hypothetical protein
VPFTVEVHDPLRAAVAVLIHCLFHWKALFMQLHDVDRAIPVGVFCQAAKFAFGIGVNGVEPAVSGSVLFHPKRLFFFVEKHPFREDAGRISFFPPLPLSSFEKIDRIDRSVAIGFLFDANDFFS